MSEWLSDGVLDNVHWRSLGPITLGTTFFLQLEHFRMSLKPIFPELPILFDTGKVESLFWYPSKCIPEIRKIFYDHQQNVFTDMSW